MTATAASRESSVPGAGGSTASGPEALMRAGLDARLGPEARVLVDCVRARFDATAPERLRAQLAAPLDWPRLLDLAESHGVTPLLFLHAESLGHAAPREFVAALRARTSRNTAQQLLLVSELRDILDALEREGLRAVPFKGPALAAALYGNVALRQSRDLDLLVRPADVAAARRVLHDRGFRAAVPLSASADSAQLASGCDLELKRERDGMLVELHWAVLHRYFAFPIEAGCWDRLTRASLLGREVPSLSPEDQLLALCGHGAKHCWERLIWIGDVVELLRRHHDLDWDDVWRRAGRVRGARVVRLALYLVGEWLGAPLPEDARRRVRADRALPALAELAIAAMDAPEGRFRAAWKSAFHVRTRDSAAEAMRYGWRRAFQLNHNDWNSVRLPDALHALYYPLRWFRLLHLHAVGAARLAARHPKP